MDGTDSLKNKMDVVAWSGGLTSFSRNVWVHRSGPKRQKYTSTNALLQKCKVAQNPHFYTITLGLSRTEIKAISVE